MRIRLCVAITITLILTGCASSDPQVVAVKTRIAPPPQACKKAPRELPRLPDREIAVGELAQNYNRLQALYRREAGRFRLCQNYVSRLKG